jgi:hypothetical protein
MYPYDKINKITTFTDPLTINGLLFWPILVILVFVVLNGLIQLSLYLINKRKKNKETRASLSFALRAISTIFLSILIGTFLFIRVIFIFIENDGYWWRIEEPARHMVDVMRADYQNTGAWPASQSELKVKFPEEMAYLEENAKIRYVTDESGSFFVFLVRPSSHFVIVYTSVPGHEFNRYALTEQYRRFWPASSTLDEGRLYPPPFAGPWEQLPQ